MGVHGGRLGLGVATLLGFALLVGGTPSEVATAGPVLSDPPATLHVSQRSTAAIVSWPPGEAAGRNWAVDYDTSATFTSAQRVNSTSSVGVLSNLTPTTTYFVRVASWDPTTGLVGAWGSTTTFTTADREYALAPPVVTPSAASTTAITVEWTRVAPHLTYQVRMGKDPATSLSTWNVDGLSTIYEELERTTKYYFTVRGMNRAGDAVTGWSVPVAFETPPDMPLRVASYNIKCANCKQKGEASWAERKAAVAETILSQQPDVVGLQEASPSRLHGRRVSQYQDLLNALGAPYKVTMAGGSGIDNRIFYNSEKVEVVRRGVVGLAKGGGRRYLVWAVFRQLSTGKTFLFGDTHLAPGKSKNALRERQTRTVITTLKRVASPQSMPTIVVGDFNMFKWMKGGGYRPYSMMIGNGYLDPLGNTYHSHSASSTAFVERRIRTNFSTFNGFKRTAPAFGYDNGTQLDFIFVTKMRVSEWETVAKVDENRRFVGTIPSDHNMVRATVWLP